MGLLSAPGTFNFSCSDIVDVAFEVGWRGREVVASCREGFRNARIIPGGAEGCAASQ